MVSRRRSDGKNIGGDGSGGEQDPDGLGDDDRLFDFEELEDWSVWLWGVDYVRAYRQAKAGDVVVRRMLRSVTRLGSRARTQLLSTRGGEPVVRVDMHPDGWRELAQRAADGDRYRSLIGSRRQKSERSDDGESHRRLMAEKAQRVYYGGGSRPDVGLMTLMALTVKHRLNPNHFDDRLKTNIQSIPIR